MPKQFDLSTHTWTTSGVKQISVVSHGAGYSDSAKSNIVTYNVYDIEPTLTNVTKSGADVIGEGQTATLTITADAGYDLPDGITVNGVTGAIGFTGCTWTWDKATGTLSISNPTQNVFVTVTGTAVATYDYEQQGSVVFLNNAPYEQNGNEVTIL